MIQRAISRNITHTSEETETETLIKRKNALINEINHLKTLRSEARKENIVCDGLNLRIAHYKRYLEQIEQQISQQIRRKVLCAFLGILIIAVLITFLFWRGTNEKN